MRTKTRELLNALQAEADKSRLCIVPTTNAQQRLLSRQRQLGTIESPWYGMYAVTDVWRHLKPDERMRRIVRTLSRRNPSWVFCNLTAALVHGLAVSYEDLLPLHVLERKPGHGKSRRNVIEHPWVADAEPCLVDGVPVTSFERTVLDCLREVDFVRGLAIADSALRVSGRNRKHFIDYIRRHALEHGSLLALDPMAWADARAANGGESAARAVMIEQGFMVPELQVKVPNLVEGGKYYADFYWDLGNAGCIVGELDGLDKYYDPEMTGGRDAVRVMSDERRRESRIGAAGARVMRFSYDEAMDVDRFVKLLKTYGIPQGRMRPRGR